MVFQNRTQTVSVGGHSNFFKLGFGTFRAWAVLSANVPFPFSGFRFFGISYLALVFFGFITGLHLEADRMKDRKTGFVVASLSSVAVPFLLSFAFGLYVFRHFPDFLGARAEEIPYAFAIGIVGSVTALPVLSAILKETGYLKKNIGQLALGMAMINDMFLWMLLAVLIIINKNSGGGTYVIASIILLSGLYLSVMWFAVRPFLQFLAENRKTGDFSGYGTLALVFVFVCLSAFITQIIGVHYLLGAFLAGAVIPKKMSQAIKDTLAVFVDVVLLPFYFMLVGIKTQFGIWDGDVWTVCAAMTVLAITSKILSVAVPAWFMLHEGDRTKDALYESLVLGVFMQSKGLMEITVLGILLQQSILSEKAFAAFLLMALITTALTKPAVLLLETVASKQRQTQG